MAIAHYAAYDGDDCNVLYPLKMNGPEVNEHWRVKLQEMETEVRFAKNRLCHAYVRQFLFSLCSLGVGVPGPNVPHPHAINLRCQRMPMKDRFCMGLIVVYPDGRLDVGYVVPLTPVAQEPPNSAFPLPTRLGTCTYIQDWITAHFISLGKFVPT